MKAKYIPGIIIGLLIVSLIFVFIYVILTDPYEGTGINRTEATSTVWEMSQYLQEKYPDEIFLLPDDQLEVISNSNGIPSYIKGKFKLTFTDNYVLVNKDLSTGLFSDNYQSVIADIEVN